MEHADRNRRFISAFRWAAALLVTSACIGAHAADLQVGAAANVSTTAADSYYSTDTTSTVDLWASGRPVELQELARALHNNVDLIYEYVRNTIEYVPIYGLQKGALGAMIDRSGTAFDQSQLMVELARAAGYTANYKVGTITLNASQVSAWLGLTDANAVRAVLNDGGIPNTVSGSPTVTSVTLAHCWVEVSIGGVSYVFDPAFKSHTFKSAVDLGTAMGWSESAFLGTATSTITASDQGTSPVPWVRHVNGSGLETTLDGYAGTLLTYLRNNHAASEMEDVIGGQDINPVTSPAGGVRQSTLPYPSTVQRSWTGNIPNPYRTKLTFEVIVPGGSTVLSRVLYADEVYGRRIVYETPSTVSSLILRLEVDGVSVASYTAALNPLSREHSLRFTIDHPYAAAAPGETGTTGHYMDASFTTRVDLALPAAVILGFDGTSQALLSKLAAEKKYDELVSVTPQQGRPGEPEPPGKASNGNHTRTKLGLNWLAQLTRMTELQARVANSQQQIHHVIGVAYADADVGLADPCIPTCGGGTYWIRDQTVLMDALVGMSLNSRTSIAADRKGALYSIAASAAALEGSLLEQSLDAGEASSTGERFEWANRAGNLASTMMYYLVNATSNASAVYYHDGQTPGLTNLRDEVSPYLTGATQAILPNDSFLGPGNRFGAKVAEGSWNPTYQRGSAFFTFREDSTGFEVNHVATSFFNRNSRGGGAGLAPMYEAQTNAAGAANLLIDKFEDRSTLYGVDLRTGELDYSPGFADLRLGEGGFPYELALQRTYHSGGAHSPGMPEGWTHNLDMRIEISGSGMEAMGGNSPLNAAGTLVAAYATQQLYKTQPSVSLDLLKRWVLGPFVQHWWTKQLRQNVVTLNQGRRALAFVRLADGNFNPPRTGVGQLLQVGNRQPVFKASGGTVSEVPAGYADEFKKWDYSGIAFTYSAPTRDVQTFGYFRKLDPSEYGPVPDFPRVHGGPGWHITSWTFPFGMRLDFTYDPSQFYPELLTSVTNNLGRTLTLAYSRSNLEADACDHLTSVTDGTRTVQYGIFCSTDGTLDSVTLPNNEIHKYEYVAQAAMPTGTRPAPDAHLARVFAPSDGAFAKAEFAYDRAWQVQTLKDAVAVKTPALRNPSTFYVSPSHRGERADPLGGLYTAYYDVRGRARQLIDEEGRVFDQLFDNHDRVKERRHPEGNKEIFTYDARTQQVASIARQAKSTSYFTPAQANINVSATYDSNCALIKTVTDARSKVTTWTYDALTCTLTKVQEPQVPDPQNSNTLTQPTTGYLYNSFGQITQVTDPTGRVTTYDYDPTTRYRWHQRVDPSSLNLTATYGHNAYGDINSVTDPRTNATGYTYDPQRRLTRVDAPLGATAIYRRDADGDIYQTEKAMNAAQTQWQIWKRILTPTKKVDQEISPTSETTKYSYDGLDRVDVVTDPDGRKTRTEYFKDGQVKRITRAYQGVTTTPVVYATYTLTPNGQIDTITDANGNVINMDYDGFDRPARTFYPDPVTGAPCVPALPHTMQTAPSCAAGQKYEQVTYDASGNLTQKLNRSGATLYFGYDDLNRRTSKTVAANSLGHFARNITTTYDLAGRPWDQGVTETNLPSQTLSYRYDSAGRIDYIDNNLLGSTNRLDVGFDAAGNRNSFTWPSGGTLTYTYDALNRMDTVSDGTVQLADYDWDTLSRRDLLRLDNAAFALDPSYEDDDDLSGLAHTGPAPLTFTFSRNHSGQITGLAVSDATFLSRPTLAAVATDTYTPNRLNQYDTFKHGSSAALTLSYDANGNLTSDGTYTYEYDEENQLRSVAGSGTTASYEYDPLGRRRSKTVNGVVTRYVSDDQQEIEERDGSNALLRKYAYGPGPDERLAMYDSIACAGGGRCFYLINWQGSTTTLVNQNGTLNATYHYGPFGEGTNWKPEDAATGNPFRYTGRRVDAETGLYYYRARFYSPRLGRFLQPDPIGTDDDIDLYAYAGNDPLNHVDPTGTNPLAGCLAGAELGPAGCVVGAVIGAFVVGAAVETVSNSPGPPSDKGKSKSATTTTSVPDVRSTPPNGFDPYGLGPAPEQPRGTGESGGNHSANVTVTDVNGNVVTRTRFDSAPMTAEESGLGFPNSMVSAHTEARAVRTVELPWSGTMRITGTRPPCTRCMGAMDSTARSSQGRIIYQWRENGVTQRWFRDYRPEINPSLRE